MTELLLIARLDIDFYYRLDNYRNCKGPTMAYQLTPSDQLALSSSITFCPWFLDYAMRKSPQFLNQVRLQRLKDFTAEMDAGTWLEIFGLRAPIDFLNLFDGTVIHEVSTQLYRILNIRDGRRILALTVATR